LEARYQRGRGGVDEYLEQTAIANPHVAIHYLDPDDNARDYQRVADVLPPEPKEIKPHPYGVELGMLVAMLKHTRESTVSAFLTKSFSRVSPAAARRICEAAGISTRASTTRIGRHEADLLYKAIQKTRISAPSTDCVVPIGEPLILKGLHQVVPGEFYAAATRPPAVYRGNPFLIEVGLAYGGGPAAPRVSRDVLVELLEETDARTLRQFLLTTFDGLGTDAADKILGEAGMKTRRSPGKLKAAEIGHLHEAMRSVNLHDGQTMNVLRYANRVPLQFQAGACAVTQTVTATNWRAYGLSQSRGALPRGPVTVMVHMASVWVPFTSESKEAIAAYPEIQKELRLALQAVGRKLGMYLRRRRRMRHEGERRNTFVRYLGEVADAVSRINRVDRRELFEQLMAVAKRKTADADVILDDRGRPVEDSQRDFGDNVLIVDPHERAEVGPDQEMSAPS
jgi:DNA topoisomerase-6 subunit B